MKELKSKNHIRMTALFIEDMILLKERFYGNLDSVAKDILDDRLAAFKKYGLRAVVTNKQRDFLLNAFAEQTLLKRLDAIK